MKNILVIDDDKDLRFLLKKILTKSGFFCHEANNGDKAMEILNQNEVDLVLCDFKLRSENGIDILISIKELHPSLPVIIITGYSNVRVAVEAMQLGAVDYMVKPLVPNELISFITSILTNPGAPQNLNSEKGSAEGSAKKVIPYILSPNESFQDILKQIDLVGPTDYSVILYGESGSGKEAFANEIHKRSKRKAKPFLAIDCGALSKELSASILFGHEKGAFTGAIHQKIGAFEMAEGGTVFLDEVTNLPYEIQVSLLRVMQERKMRRVGGNADITINVRIIVASNQKLWDVVKAKNFREDLYHRFNEFSIDVPPLRERKEDILFYADFFIAQCNEELNKNVKGFSPAATRILLNYPWPGNLRELKNVVKRSVLITEGEFIEIEVLPEEILNETFGDSRFNSGKGDTGKGREHKYSMEEQAEADYGNIIDALRNTFFDKKKSAEALNIDVKTLNHKMKLYADMKGFRIDF